MTKVVTKVCDNTDSGSNKPVVHVKFRSRKFKFREKDETSTCVTEVLNSEKVGKNKDDWARGSTQTWGYQHFDDWLHGAQEHNFLGRCAKLQPHDQLVFKVVIHRKVETVFDYLWIDDIEICGLNVTFGSAGETNSKWGWRSGGKKGVWTKEGQDTSETEWLSLIEEDSDRLRA